MRRKRRRIYSKQSSERCGRGARPRVGAGDEDCRSQLTGRRVGGGGGGGGGGSRRRGLVMQYYHMTRQKVHETTQKKKKEKGLVGGVS
jgi:hypothetical protein